VKSARWLAFALSVCFLGEDGETREALWHQTYPFAPDASFASDVAFTAGGQIVLAADGGVIGIAVRTGVTAWMRPGASPRLALSPDGTIFTVEIRGGAVAAARLGAGGNTVWEVLTRD